MKGLTSWLSPEWILIAWMLTVILRVQVVYSDDQLKWLTDEGIVDGVFRGSVVINCRLSDSKVNVSFWKRLPHSNTLVSIKFDGKKYVRISNQEYQINHLGQSDGTMYICRAAGINQKSIDLFIIPEPNLSDYTVTLVQEKSSKRSCNRKGDYNRTLICESYGQAKLELFKVVKTVRKLVANDKNAILTSVTEKGHWKQTLTYTIKDATKEDEGQYLCGLNISWFGRTIWSNYIHLFVRDSAPTIESFRAKEVAEGASRVTLRCKTDKSTPPDTVTFLINGVPISKSRVHDRYKTSCQKLKINNPVFPDDNVTIGCKVENKYGFDLMNATLMVLVTPEIDKTTSAVVEKNGYIECKIKRSNPAPKIRWEMQPYCVRLKDCWPKKKLWRKVPNESFRIISSNSSQDSTLLVPSSSKQHYFFRCIAENKAGSDEHIVKFIYSGEDRKTLMVVPRKAKINEKGNLQLTCIVTPALFSQITWLKDGENVTSRYQTSTQFYSSYPSKSMLTIENATMKDSGNFTCIGTGVQGGVEKISALVQVKEIFSPTVQLKGHEISQGENVILRCNVKSNPSALIRWYKDGNELTETGVLHDEDQCSTAINGYYFTIKNGNKFKSHLIICRVDFSINNGTYTCSARNHLGSSHARANLIVFSKPDIIENNRVLTVENGDSIEENCTAIGNPRPLVTWYHKSTKTLINGPHLSYSVLVINAMSDGDYGDYECKASNSHGETVKSLEINHPNIITAQTTAKKRGFDSTAKARLYVYLAVGFMFALFIICIVFLLLRRKKIYGGLYLFSQPPSPDHFRDIDPTRALIEQTNGLPYDSAWEFPRKRVKILNRLGSGAFGDVYMAEAVGIVCFEPREKISMRQKPLLGRRRSRTGSTSSRTGSNYRRHITTVAVKKLKENATPEEMRDLISELKILIHIGQHNNIVILLGACTKGGEKDLMLILEYAPHGNLLSFLKNRRTIFKTVWKKQSIGMDSELTTCDLVVIAYQIAKGMEFLASRRCVHRDLAARNVLIGEGHVVKIADFGLARDIYNDDRYVKLSAGLLPVKWMAIEAVRDRIFTHQSDVWSFGILLWEIMTMGGSPYPGLPVRDLLNMLLTGYRMEQPIYCPPEVYALMRDCWVENADDRPFFIEIVNRLARSIESHVPPEDCCHYLDQEHINGDGYLRPVESPRSPVDNFMSPPPPYSAYLHQRESENRFFGSDSSIDEKSITKREDADVVSLNKSRLNSVSEMKAKRDAAQKEKKSSDTSSLSDIESENEADTCQATACSPLLQAEVFYDKEKERVQLYDSDKDLDEVELQIADDSHSYVNQTEKDKEGPYLNCYI